MPFKSSPRAASKSYLPNKEQLNEMQLVDYREHRWKFIEWPRTKGKNPEKREGYSDYPAYETGYRTARFDRWVWNHKDRYTVPPRPEHADEYVDENVEYRDVTLTPPARPTFEVKAEREGPAGNMTELSVEFEIEWDENAGEESSGSDQLEIE